jgi:AraC family transcriptional regulator, transcriptional activator of pobA
VNLQEVSLLGTMPGSAPFETYPSLYETYKNLGLPVDSIDQSFDFTINNLAEIHSQAPFKSSVYRPSYFSFVFVKDANGKYITDDLTFETVPGTIYFTNPGHLKAFEWFRVQELYLITFSESFLKENVHPEIFEEFPFLLAETVRPRTLDPEAFGEFEKLYLQILNEYKGTSPFRKRIIGNLFVVLLLKIKEYFWSDYNPIYEGNRSSQIVKIFKENLEKHYRDLAEGKVQVVFQVQDYARLQSLNANYLSNVIKTKTGKTISSWIADKTIAEAKSLLKNSSISIKEVAFRLGFTEANHFSNYFKKYTSLTPNAFRKTS